jgi:hypothetical protein
MGSTGFAGRIDEVRIYNAAPSQIQANTPIGARRVSGQSTAAATKD